MVERLFVLWTHTLVYEMVPRHRWHDLVKLFLTAGMLLIIRGDRCAQHRYNTIAASRFFLLSAWAMGLVIGLHFHVLIL